MAEAPRVEPPICLAAALAGIPIVAFGTILIVTAYRISATSAKVAVRFIRVRI